MYVHELPNMKVLCTLMDSLTTTYKHRDILALSSTISASHKALRRRHQVRPTTPTIYPMYLTSQARIAVHQGILGRCETTLADWVHSLLLRFGADGRAG